ncbi:RNA polymerase recycling motor HelD [Apilactobacillus ozensis]|uniref:RNA polymerase recycling motor HelD n=1 Tax=Apilactobacillus ozensis TaxID=866801 RepID=UPI00200A1253|nr:RNA polymerase recycling motor HelD [Apilactobacillus ozensis]MCK8607548.1 UvrD-helicase domain-containing protein [Apilactobacillus ozensis]
MNSNEIKLEQNRVNAVVKKVNAKIEDTNKEYEKAKQETKNVQTNYSNNTSVNYFEVDDRIETSAELQQQRGLVNRVVENESIINNQLKKLKDLADSPYFGRIDIKDDDEPEIEKLYIGTSSFVDKNQEFLVYDWRAPISSIYYNGTLGKTSYQTPVGNQQTELKKKRQFSIKAGQIKNMFDTNETVGDEMLQNVLGQHNDEKMQNIVSTIQKEQNDIIRDTKSDLLIVQGAAGSGKTSTLLQRIAFLLYHSRDSLDADQIVLFSPNRLFDRYISDVLPSLGEKNMQQVTFSEFVAHRLEGLNVETIFDKYEISSSDHELKNDVSEIKGSNQFIKAIENYCNKIDGSEIAFNNISLDGEVYFSKEHIESIYDELPKLMQSKDKFLQTKNTLIKELKKIINDSVSKPWVDKAIDNLNSEQYHDLLKDYKISMFQDEIDERNYIAKTIVKNKLQKVYDAIFNGNFFDPYIQYMNFLNSLDEKIIPNKVIKEFSQNLEFHKISLDDVAPLLYLRSILTGDGQNQKIKHLFVDEMQDYSIAQLTYIKHAFPNAKLNLMGDSEQALFKNVETPEQLLQKLNNAFPTNHSRLIKLNRSYRSTYEITNFAKSILPENNDIEPFNRKGKMPKILIRKNENQAIDSILKEIKSLGNKNKAIITKNMQEAKYLYRHLYNKINVTLMSDKDRSIPEESLIIIPVYLAKGLEFDSVIAWNVSQENYSYSNKLLGTLYTIITRAMHQLTLVSIGKVSNIISSHENKVIIDYKI